MTVMMVQRVCSLHPGVDRLYRTEKRDVFFLLVWAGWLLCLLDQEKNSEYDHVTINWNVWMYENTIAAGWHLESGMSNGTTYII